MGENLVSLIIAAFCILALLILVGWLLWAFIFSSNKPEQAEINIKMIGERIEDLRIGDSTKITLESPSEWVIVAWPNKEREEKPLKACKMEKKEDYDNSCLCICKDGSLYNSELLDNCNDESTGKCIDIDGELEIDKFFEKKIEIDGVINLNVTRKEDKFTLKEI